MAVSPESMKILAPAELKAFYPEGISPSSEDLADAAAARRLGLSKYDYLLRPAQTLCRWLLKADHAETLAGYATRLLAYGLAVLDDERVRRFLQQTVAETLQRADVAAAAAQVLDVLTENQRHHALLDEALAGLLIAALTQLAR